MGWIVLAGAALVLAAAAGWIDARWRNLGLGVLAGWVVAVHLGLPEGHPLRVWVGGTLAGWAAFGGAVLAGWAYARWLARLRLAAAAAGVPGHAASSPAPAAGAVAMSSAPAQGSGDGTGGGGGGPQGDALSAEELHRYARHIILREVGGAGQMRLRRAKVLVIGAGGLGSPALMYLAAAGVGRIGVIDHDEVDLSNLQRQIIHTTDRIGMNKARSAAIAMAAINPHVAVVPIEQRLEPEAAAALFADWDIILDGTDNFDTRYAANAGAVAAGKPLVAAAITQWEGQISVYNPASGAPCYRCVFPEPPAPGLVPSCAEAGVIGALPGVVGSMMAVETIKLITGAGQPLRGEMLIYDALWGESRKMRLHARPDCPDCGHLRHDGAPG